MLIVLYNEFVIMAVLNIEKSFLTDNKSVYDFLDQSGQGLYIPLYQRDYSWDNDNIEQLLEDLTRGIQRIASGEITDPNKEIRFLGTVITVIEPDRNNIYPLDIQALPSRIEKLIDGQQRVSTIALMATILTKRLYQIRNKVDSGNPISSDIEEICDYWIKKLLSVFSFDLGRGYPKLKPKIIRGAKDYWTRDKSDDEAYQSELSNYLARFIRAYADNKPFPCLPKVNSLLCKNGRRIESWLQKVVAVAHENKSDEDFSAASDILAHFEQEMLWNFVRPNLVDIVKQGDFSNKKTDSYIVSELVQTLAVCHYLLDRCCFTIIQPTDDDWAFDMFQSLNATGTPLTAIETFKPLVVNTVDNSKGCQFKDSNSDIYFKKIEDFLSDATTAQRKNKLTNDYLTSFFVAYDGRTISSHFSYQRKVLNIVYDSQSTYEAKETFIKRMGNYAEFYQMWLKYDGKGVLPIISGADDAILASMLMLFLRSSNHKMAITVFASLFGDSKYSKELFVDSVKCVAAYFFLWRSTSSNSGLDSTYREFFKHNSGESFTLENLKKYFRDMLNKKEIDTANNWKIKAKNYLKYDKTGKDIVRLALLIAADDTIADADNKGLIKKGRPGCSSFLNLDKWNSVDTKSIEHVAPQKNVNGLWDSNMYDENIQTYQSIGNLTLLPQDLNSSASNKGWKEKLLYYQCVAEKDLAVINNIENKASELGITINRNTVELLKNSTFNDHLSAISSMSVNDVWNKDLVDKRTEVMLDIIWDRVSKWIF